MKEHIDGKNYRISPNFEENNNQEFLSFVRFIVL
jgi:hypothetical protein